MCKLDINTFKRDNPSFARWCTFGAPAHASTRNLFTQNTHRSSSCLQPRVSAASETGRRASASPGATQQQRNSRLERPAGQMRDGVFETPPYASTWNLLTQTLTALRHAFSHAYPQLLKQAGEPAHHLKRHSSRETADQSANSPRCETARLNAPHTPATTAVTRTDSPPFVILSTTRSGSF